MELLGCTNETLCPGFNSCSSAHFYQDTIQEANAVSFTDIYNYSCNCSSWNQDTKHVRTPKGCGHCVVVFG